MINYKKIRTFVLSTIIVSGLLAWAADNVQAQEADGVRSLIPAENSILVETEFSAAGETHPPLRLTPDKSEILNVDNTIERVIIGNEQHVNIFLDTAKRIIIVPRAPGATHFTLMGKDGKIVMQRHVIVAGPKQDYVRIRRSCGLSAGGDCEPTRVYYCPGMCHEIGLSDGAAAGNQNAITLSFPDEMMEMGAAPPMLDGSEE